MKTRSTTWKRKIEILNTFKGRINATFREARQAHLTHEEILNNIKARVMDHPDMAFMTARMRAEINGYTFANFDNMYYFVTWSHWYNGTFVGKELPYGLDFDQNLVESAHCYTGTDHIYTERKKA